MSGDVTADRTCFTIHTRGIDWDTCERPEGAHGVRGGDCGSSMAHQLISVNAIHKTRSLTRRLRLERTKPLTIVVSYCECEGCGWHEPNRAGQAFLTHLGLRHHAVHGPLVLGIPLTSSDEDVIFNTDDDQFLTLWNVVAKTWSLWLSHQVATPREHRALADLGTLSAHAY